MQYLEMTLPAPGRVLKAVGHPPSRYKRMDQSWCRRDSNLFYIDLANLQPRQTIKHPRHADHGAEQVQERRNESTQSARPAHNNLESHGGAEAGSTDRQAAHASSRDHVWAAVLRQSYAIASGMCTAPKLDSHRANIARRYSACVKISA
jgi:hypothetical protein